MRSRLMSGILLMSAFCSLSGSASAQTPPGGFGPGDCLLPTPFCSYTKNAQGLPIPDQNCIPAFNSLGFPTGAPSPKPDSQGSPNDGARCGVNKQTSKLCGGYLSRTPSCTGDASVCNPYDPLATCCDPFLVTCGGGGGDPCAGSPSGDCSDLAPGHASSKAAEAELTRAAGQDLPVAIRTLVAQLAGFKSVHLKARVLIAESSNPLSSGVQSVTGASFLTAYEYWESGGHYRIHTYIDPKMGFQEITGVAFDGRLHQLVTQEGRDLRLTLTPQDDRSVFIPIANPLFLPLAFLSPSDENRCLFCELRLADFAVLNLSLHDHGTGKGATSSGAQESDVRGGVNSNKQTRYQAEFDDSARVKRILWVTADGGKLSEMEFHDYRTATGARFAYPRAIQVARSLDQAKEPWIVFKYVVDELEFDQPIAESQFTISQDSMDTVVDSSNRFLKFRRSDRKDFCAFPPS